MFIIVSALIDILGYFSDVGLAAALIQKKEKPTIKEIRSTFTIQQCLVLFIIIVLLLLSPLIKKIYQFDADGTLLLYSFALAFFLSSLKTIPSVLLERELEFTKIIVPQLLETIAFNVVVVFMSWKGYGLKSYTYAVLARSLLGTITLYILAPWPIGLNFSFSVLKKLFRYGIPYQLNSLLAVVKDKFMILLLGRMIGNDGIALMGWAEKWATMPLRYLLDNTIKVAFPAFARLQHDSLRLKKAIEKTLYFLTVALMPTLAGIAIISRPLISIIPRYLKWQPALIPLYLYCFASIWGSLAVFLTTIFNAIGQIKTTFKLMILWTTLSWLVTPILAAKANVVGVALAVIVVNISSIVAIFIVKKWVNINFIAQVKGPFLSSALMLLISFYLQSLLPKNLWGVLISIMTGGIIYTAALILLDNKKLLDEFNYLKKEIRLNRK